MINTSTCGQTAVETGEQGVGLPEATIARSCGAAPHCVPTLQPIHHRAQLATSLQKHNTLRAYESIDMLTLFAWDSRFMCCAYQLDGELISSAAQHCSIRWVATPRSEGLSCDHHSTIKGGKG